VTVPNPSYFVSDKLAEIKADLALLVNALNKDENFEPAGEAQLALMQVSVLEHKISDVGIHEWTWDMIEEKGK
jgi:hypothetical protein